MPADELLNARRVRLQERLVKAALDLLAFSQATGVKAIIEGTTPPVYILVGDADAIQELMQEQ